MARARLTALVLPLAFGLSLGAVALAQSQIVYPPVPGPYMLAAPTMPARGAEPAASAGQTVFPAPGMLDAPGQTAPQRPQQFSGPLGGMAVPYWMQPTPAPNTATTGRTETAGAGSTDQANSRPAVATQAPNRSAAPQQAAPRYGQTTTPGAFPGYGAPAQPWRQPGAQPQAGGWQQPQAGGWQQPQAGGWQQPAAPTWQQPAAPGWGYARPAPGWGAAPYVPQPGWTAPSRGTGQAAPGRQ